MTLNRELKSSRIIFISPLQIKLFINKNPVGYVPPAYWAYPVVLGGGGSGQPPLDADPPGCRPQTHLMQTPLDADPNPPDADPPGCRPPPRCRPPGLMTCDACWEDNPAPSPGEQNDWQIDVKTLPCPELLLLAVKRMLSNPDFISCSCKIKLVAIGRWNT